MPMNVAANQGTVLLIEDDENVVRSLVPSLRAHGFHAAHEPRAEAGLSRIRKLRPDAVLLDLALAGSDGSGMCSTVREVYAGAIIALTSREGELEHVLALERGADDLLPKSVQPLVLLAHLKAVLRRVRARTSQPPSRGNLCFGRLAIDGVARTVILREREIALTSAEFDLLWLLASRAGRIVSRVDLREVLHGCNDGNAVRAYDTQISHLRRLLGEDARAPHGIKTVRGKGYLFNPRGWN